MRRRRNSLQVSTFPFLAVLLCTMGSLILLLLVIDRRARVVAAVKARKAMEQSLVEDAKTAEARRAEWERRRRLLHEQLANQDEQMTAKLESARAEESRLAGAMGSDESKVQTLRSQLRTEQEQLARWEESLWAGRREQERVSRDSAASKTELAQLTAELERMEQTLADLKALRQRQQQTYSLIPYRGKRGDNRRPIYVECTANSLIFHPDRQTLALGPFFSPAGFKEQIDQRVAARRASAFAVNGGADDNEYVLLLIRPGGITTYYQATAILQRLKMDFGYEFIDAGWVLDFPEDDAARPGQPWMIAGSGSSASAGKGPTRKVTGIQPSSNPDLILKATAASQGSDGYASPAASGPASNFPGGRSGGQGAPAGRADIPSGPYIPGANSGIEMPNAMRSGPLVATHTGPPGVIGGTSPPLSQDAAGQGSSRGPEVAIGAPVPGRGLPSVVSVAGSGEATPGIGSNNGQPGNPASDSSHHGVAGSNGQPSGASDPGIGGPPAPQSAGASPQGSEQNGLPALPVVGAPPRAGGSGSGMSASGAGTPGQAQEGGSGSGMSASGTGMPGQAQERAQESPSTRSPNDSSSAADARQAAPTDRLSALGPRDSPRKNARGAGLRPTLLTGNRDWTIAIECTADALVILPTGHTIAATALGQQDTSQNALLKSVQQLIARRQATVPPGEPPYRPMIRFRVHADALRTYYLAYPALEALGVPMSRESVRPDDESRKDGSR